MKKASKYFAIILIALFLLFFSIYAVINLLISFNVPLGEQLITAESVMGDIGFILFPIVIIVVAIILKKQKNNSGKEEDRSNNKEKAKKTFKYVYIFLSLLVLVSFIIYGILRILIRYNVVNNESFIIFTDILSYVALIAALILILVGILLLYKKEGHAVSNNYIKKQFSFIQKTYSIPFHNKARVYDYNMLSWKNDTIEIIIKWDVFNKVFKIKVDHYNNPGYLVKEYEEEFNCIDTRYSSKVKFAANWLRESIESGKIKIK
ncbi:MAG: hypothetical protein H6687_00775 [Bacillales bacterium]|nr:hypothetical protein [Bacillales bacterium]